MVESSEKNKSEKVKESKGSKESKEIEKLEEEKAADVKESKEDVEESIEEQKESEEINEDSEDLEIFGEELMNEWISRNGRVVDLSVSELESGVERPMTQIRLEQAMEQIPTLMGDKKYTSSNGYESGTSYEAKTIYSPAQETRAPVFDQAGSDFFRTPTIVAQPNQNQQNTQGWGSQQNQQEGQAEEERKKQNRRF
jgi:hypothetical protein